jgi:hypothetical protein
MKIIENIKKVCKKKFKIISKIINSKKEYNIKFIKNSKYSEMALCIDDKIIIKGPYSFYGIYQPLTKLWIWASSIPGVDKRHINKINEIKEYNHIFENNNDTKMAFYYQLLTEDAILITKGEMLLWINELLLYLSDDMYYFNPINKDNNMQFIILSNIKEKYTK